MRFDLQAFTKLASRFAFASALALPAAGLAENAGPAIDGFRAKVEKWVQTRQLISEERSDWEADKQALRATHDLLAQENAALEAEIAELEESSTEADEERRELLLRRGDYQRVNVFLAEQIRAMEQEVLALAPGLPEPLQKKLDLLLVQIPEDIDAGERAIPLGQRLMNVLGVLAQTEKWNGTATMVGETRAVGGEQKVQIRTLYWGLGLAYYADMRGEAAGVGRPGPSGWTFNDDPSLASDASKLLDIYEGNVDVIEFISLPVEIQ